MKVGDNIREIRETEKNYKRSFMADKLKISTRAYANIENNITDISLRRLEEIAHIFNCSPTYILTFKEAKQEFYNHFHNNGNSGINIMNQIQGMQSKNSDLLISDLKDELLKSEKKRITLLEELLRKNNIDI